MHHVICATGVYAVIAQLDSLVLYHKRKAVMVSSSPNDLHKVQERVGTSL